MGSLDMKSMTALELPVQIYQPFKKSKKFFF